MITRITRATALSSARTCISRPRRWTPKFLRRRHRHLGAPAGHRPAGARLRHSIVLPPVRPVLVEGHKNAWFCGYTPTLSTAGGRAIRNPKCRSHRRPPCSMTASRGTWPAADLATLHDCRDRRHAGGRLRSPANRRTHDHAACGDGSNDDARAGWRPRATSRFLRSWACPRTTRPASSPVRIRGRARRHRQGGNGRPGEDPVAQRRDDGHVGLDRHSGGGADVTAASPRGQTSFLHSRWCAS